MSYRYPVTAQLIIDYISFDMLDDTATSCGRWDLISSHKSTVRVPMDCMQSRGVYKGELGNIPQSLKR